MVVCRVSDGCLLVNSPICHTKELSDCLEALGGGVGHIGMLMTTSLNISIQSILL